jgi:hypothetical protein
MELSGYYGSSSGERASERQRRLTVNQSWRKPVRRFESCRSHNGKSGGGSCLLPTPNGMGTGLLSRPESVRARPAAPIRDQGCKL